MKPLILIMQSKRYPGESTETECENLQKALSSNKTQKSNVLFNPSWSQERTKSLISTSNNEGL